MTSKNSTLVALDEKIADLSESEDYEDEATVALEYHGKLRNTAIRVRYFLNSAERPGYAPVRRVVTDTGNQGDFTQAISRTPLQVALPKLHIPVSS
ncbi:hypothetical protein HPB50_006542 [Hyalomma asiaticum]|uniref:Uncharacterized protein n=1 Tax=Hyalomma asiaticum TaxID=266040 RepID=A0ACB7T1I3_HYAAI|nr:hypothetical protein HPB50_006542 [Hyalomma asiaticum]